MTRDELYINGIKADLEKTDISLNYKSNLLTDISKIVSNNSYTIKLPKTAKNLSIIECANIPSSTTKFPYLMHAGTVLRNGIEIIKDANVVLLETNESIEIALTWGNVTNFANVVNNGKKLTDISHGTVEGTDWVVWNNKGSNSAQFPLINYGFNSGEPNAWYRPVVTAKWILDRIQEESGVMFNFPSDKLNLINKMIVPLFTNNDSQEIYDAYPSYININGYNTVANSVSYLKLSHSGDSTQANFAEVTGYYNNDLYTKWDTDIKVKGDVSLSVTYNAGIDYYNKELRLHVKEIDSLGNVIIKNSIIKKTKGAYVTPPFIK